MLPPFPPLTDQQKKDSEHIDLLSVFHFVFAGFALLGLGFLYLHYFFMHEIFMNPEFWQKKNLTPPPELFLKFFSVFYVVMGAFIIIGGILNLISGIFMRQRKNRLFSLIVAGLNCMQIPFGTILGIFTLIVLTRHSVGELYATKVGSPTE